MKLPIYLLIIPFLWLSMGCSSTEKTNSDIRPGVDVSRPDGAVSDDRDYYRSLADYLRQVPGVHITGSDSNAHVTIRGVSSFNSDNRPLYVINGQSVGTDYGQVNRMINVRDIDYVRVLKGSEASIYGVRGGNGVILIVTK